MLLPYYPVFLRIKFLPLLLKYFLTYPHVLLQRALLELSPAAFRTLLHGLILVIVLKLIHRRGLVLGRRALLILLNPLLVHIDQIIRVVGNVPAVHVGLVSLAAVALGISAGRFVILVRAVLVHVLQLTLRLPELGKRSVVHLEWALSFHLLTLLGLEQRECTSDFLLGHRTAPGVTSFDAGLRHAAVVLQRKFGLLGEIHPAIV